jgi:hypothetical protein
MTPHALITVSMLALGIAMLGMALIVLALTH